MTRAPRALWAWTRWASSRAFNALWRWQRVRRDRCVHPAMWHAQDARWMCDRCGEWVRWVHP